MEQLDVDLDPDLVTHHEPTGLQRVVPGQPEVLPVDLRFGGRRPLEVPDVIPDFIVGGPDREDDGTCDAVNGEVAGHVVARFGASHRGAPKLDGRESLDVEEV